MKEIYLDHNASTRPYREVLELFAELSLKNFNPASVHSTGMEGRRVIRESKEKFLSSFAPSAAGGYEVIFTSGGTEANNLIISNFLDGEIFVSGAEHPSITEYSNFYPNVKIIGLKENGAVDLESLAKGLENSPAKKKLVSVGLAGGETGILQDIGTVSGIAKKYGAFFHSDLAQAAGKIGLDAGGYGLDYATFSGHKFGAPVGVGALVFKKNLSLKPSLIGGGQQKGIRSGTESVALIASMALAASMATGDLAHYIEKTSSLRDYLEESLFKRYPSVNIIGKNSKRLPNTSLITQSGRGADISVIALDLKGFRVSAGSACSSGKVERLKVLDFMGVEKAEASSAVRISLSSSNNREDIEAFVKSWGDL